MSAYLGKSDCTSPDCTQMYETHRDGSKTSKCFDYHCVHCHGHANCMGVCNARCAGHQSDDRSS